MKLFELIAQFSFYAMMAVILIAAILTVTVRNLFRAAIFLALTLLGVAGVYFLLHAEFLAAVQILIYVGAIMTLIIFAIMLRSRMGDPTIPQTNRQKIPALILLACFGLVLIPLAVKTPWPVALILQHIDAVQVGKALMGEFVFPFELVSLVLLIALVGAIVIARSDE
jgi:NADH:ubiquinone oxidoreductase subunit 6 (subunit J)